MGIGALDQSSFTSVTGSLANWVKLRQIDTNNNAGNEASAIHVILYLMSSATATEIPVKATRSRLVRVFLHPFERPYRSMTQFWHWRAWHC